MRTAILGTVGVPGRYGGFETLADNLVRYHDQMGHDSSLTVYCSAEAADSKVSTYCRANLRYISISANGAQSVIYDALSIFDAVRLGHNRLLLLGVSGALILPFVRLFSPAKIITNIDGIEWRREKWTGFARAVLRALEWAAVRFSHTVIADNRAIADYVRDRYSVDCEMISYGGDHALEAEPDYAAVASLPETYALALCRIEPENNVHLILEAWALLDTPLVFVGNWNGSAYGRRLKERFAQFSHIHILDPIYERSALRAVRDRASLYVHGHSAGGTNPSLVEMMHFGIPVVAYRCSFNRYTTDDQARYFESHLELAKMVVELDSEEAAAIGVVMGQIARTRYTWERIGLQYFRLLEKIA